jgi:hypothetical protein
LLLVAGESIDIQLGAYVDASGGGGQDASAGGGAGGIISLEAPTVTVGGTLHTRGGGGGCWQNNGSDGWMGGSGCTDVVAGGDGGLNAGGLDGEDGAPAPSNIGGAGGGGSGIIVINVGPAQGAPTVTGSLIPTAATSAVHLGTITPE